MEGQEREENLGCVEGNAFVANTTVTHTYSFNLKRKHISAWYIIYPGDTYPEEQQLNKTLPVGKF